MFRTLEERSPIRSNFDSLLIGRRRDVFVLSFRESFHEIDSGRIERGQSALEGSPVEQGA